MTIERFVDFFKEHKKLFEDGDYTTIYTILNDMWYQSHDNLHAKDIGDFTSILLDFGVNPLEYMTEVPDLYFYEQPYETTFIIPDNIEHVGAHSFDEAQIESIIVGSGVRSIDQGAFAFNGKLKSVEIRGPVEKIKTGAFQGCPLLEHIELPKTVKDLYSQVFLHCHALTSIEIPEGVTEIGTQLFDECNSLQSVKIGGAVKEIWARAFYNCTALKKIIYNNTRDSWYNISKHPDWNLFTPSFKVVCQDGELDV